MRECSAREVDTPVTAAQTPVESSVEGPGSATRTPRGKRATKVRDCVEEGEIR